MKNTQTGFIGIIIIIIVATGLVGGGYYVSTHKKSNVEVDTMTADAIESKTEEELKFEQGMELRNSISTIKFSSQAKEADVVLVKNFIEKQKGVVSVEYTSAVQGLADFKERHKDDVETLKKINEVVQNPVGAKIVVKFSSSSDRDTVLNSLKTNAQFSIVETIN